MQTIPIRVKRRRVSAVEAGLASLLTAFCFFVDARAAWPPQPESFQAVHRHGQTFLTWTERTDLAEERYRVYRHTQPISAANIAQATPVYEVPEGSALFFANRYAEGETWQYRYFERLVIADRAAPLPPGTGLLVWTLAAADFAGGASGLAHYAVVTRTRDGEENLVDFGPGNTTGPVAESLAPPKPVETAANIGAGGRLYIQYQDLRDWNPSFHAPNPGNGFYGLAPEAYGVPGAVQYAYDYAVYEPDPYCAGNVPSRAPVVLVLHGWGGNAYGPLTEIPDPWWCAFKIYPVDQSETWWFGFAANHDFRGSSAIGSGDEAGNFTERRVLAMVDALLRDPVLGPRADPERVYVFGHSMGGSGTLALAMRYPNVFAAAYASEPMTNYRTSGDGGGLDWRGDLGNKWGGPELNLPVKIRAPAGWADPLAPFEGTGVWDWQNHQGNLASRRGDDKVPLGLAHGTNDSVIEWPTQGRPAYPAFDEGRVCWGGAVVEADHTWLGFQGLPPSLAMDLDWTPFQGMRVVRGESVPGLARVSGDPPLPPTAPGDYHAALEWSSSWAPWDDGAPIDTPDLWRVSLRSVDGFVHTADVTPRRVRHFGVVPGLYGWENRRLSDGVLEASGVVAPDRDNLLTIPSVAVSPGGNRVSLRRTGMLTGDLDQDGRVGAADLVVLANYLAGNLVQGPPPFTAPPAAADLDANGVVNGLDVALLARALTKSSTPLPQQK